MEWLRKLLEESRDAANEDIRRYEGKVEAYDNILHWFNPREVCQECGMGYWKGNNNSPERDVEIEKHRSERHSSDN